VSVIISRRAKIRMELTEDEFLRLWGELVDEWKVSAAEDLLEGLLLRQQPSTNFQLNLFGKD
jgi:hypothetical protein